MKPTRCSSFLMVRRFVRVFNSSSIWFNDANGTFIFFLKTGWIFGFNLDLADILHLPTPSEKTSGNVPLNSSFNLSASAVKFCIFWQKEFMGISHDWNYSIQSVRKRLGICPRGVMVKAMECGIIESEFELQSCYYVHFRTNTLGKGRSLVILLLMS